MTTTLLATGVTGILQIIFTLPSVLFLDHFGRKTFLIVGAIGMCICHVVVAAVDGVYEDQWALNQGLARSAGWASIAFIWLFAANFAYSWGPVACDMTEIGDKGERRQVPDDMCIEARELRLVAGRAPSIYLSTACTPGMCRVGGTMFRVT